MALEAMRDSVDDLPEPLQKEYRKDEESGKFILDVTPVDGRSLENVDSLRVALSSKKTEVEKLRKQVEKYKDIDPEKAREAMTKLEEMANWTPEQKVKEQIEAQKKQLLEAHGQEKQKLEGKLGSLTKQLEGLLVNSAAAKAIATEEGSVDLLLPHITSRTKIRETEDGRYLVDVIDAEGNVRVNGQGKEMTIDELVAEMKQDKKFAAAFKGTGASGTGAQGGSNGRSGGSSDEDLAKLPPAERMKEWRRRQAAGAKA